MPRAASLAAILVLAASALCSRPLAAQTEFAVPLGRGQLRLDLTPVWSSWDHRFDPSAGGLVPLTADYVLASLGAANLPFLGPYQTRIQDASGDVKFKIDLGRPLIALTSSVRTIPIGMELGLSRRLSIGVTVPIVRSRVDASFQLDTAAATRSNVGFNPGLRDTSLVGGFRREMTAALAALQTQATSGPPALRAQAQAAIAALQPYLALSASPLLPRGATAAAESISTRLGRADSVYRDLATQYAAVGDSLPPLTKALALPDSTPLGRDDVERLFSDPAFPIAADTFGTVVRTGIGDITAHATFQFAEGARYRGQLLVTTRFPTGKAPSASNFLDLGTGTHEFGLEAALASDFLLGGSFLVHGVARAGGSGSDELPMRVTPPQYPIAPIAQLATIKRKPAPYVGIEVDPTWLMDDAFSVRVSYSFFTQGATAHSYVDAGDAARVGLPASVLDEGTAARWMRMGGAVTFSTAERYAKGRASLPYSVSVGYDKTIWGRTGRVPQEGIFHINFRAYFTVLK